jgi:hypothetical protein
MIIEKECLSSFGSRITSAIILVLFLSMHQAMIRVLFVLLALFERYWVRLGLPHPPIACFIEMLLRGYEAFHLALGRGKKVDFSRILRRWPERLLYQIGY